MILTSLEVMMMFIYEPSSTGPELEAKYMYSGIGTCTRI